MIVEIVNLLRPKSWTKNLFLFAALIFSLHFFHLELLVKTIYGFFLFCLLSGCIYIINDLKDIELDRFHPEKSKRPLSSGKISKRTALILFGILLPFTMAQIFYLDLRFFLTAIVYLVIQFLYTFYIKNLVILDLFSVASGFLLRVISGAFIIDVEISLWLLVCTCMLALFLGFCKRRSELKVLKENSVLHRKVLFEYNTLFLDQMISVVTASTLITYILYTMAEDTIRKFHSRFLILTVPFVLYGIFRYLYLVYHKEYGGSPEQILLKDKPLMLNLLLWAFTVIIILYLGF